MPTNDLLPARRGRPRKFAGPSTAVTVTLPNDVIAALQSIDRDIGRAVVRLVQPRLRDRPRPAAELSTFGDRAIIVVPRSPQLRARTGVELIPLSDGRALISFDDHLSVHQIELYARDALEDATMSAADRAMFEALAGILRKARCSDSIVARQRSVIVLQRARARANPRRAGRRRERSSPRN